MTCVQWSVTLGGSRELPYSWNISGSVTPRHDLPASVSLHAARSIVISSTSAPHSTQLKSPPAENHGSTVSMVPIWLCPCLEPLPLPPWGPLAWQTSALACPKHASLNQRPFTPPHFISFLTLTADKLFMPISLPPCSLSVPCL